MNFDLKACIVQFCYRDHKYTTMVDVILGKRSFDGVGIGSHILTRTHTIIDQEFRAKLCDDNYMLSMKIQTSNLKAHVKSLYYHCRL